MPETFLVPFDYDAHSARAAGARGKTALRRGRAAIEVASVRMSDVEVAYRVAHRSDLGRGASVVRHDGRLWWALVDTALTLSTRTARDFLRDLRAGKCDLFVRRCLDDHHLEHHRRRYIAYDDHDATLAAVHRSARDVLDSG